MDNVFMELTTKVKKPVEAIQCANTFGLLQRKMYNVLLANAAGNLRPDVTHRITMRNLCVLMGYRSNDYKTIKQKFRELRRMDIEWDVINENGNKVWTNTSPLSLARVIEGEGVCEYEFTPSLVPFLDKPAQYAKFSLIIQAKFKSSYGLALYENCERYKNIGHTRAFDIPTFRKLMGVSTTEYLDFFALKRRVINKAIKEVNQHADFEIKPDYKKEGRAVVSIRFMILKPNCVNVENVQSKNKLEQDDLIMEIKKYFNLLDKDIEKLLRRYGSDYVKQKLNLILSSDSFKKGSIANMAAYLRTALAEDYQPNFTSRQVIEKQHRENEILMETQRNRDKLFSELQTEYERYLSKELPKLTATLADSNRSILIQQFELKISNTCYRASYERLGFNDALVADYFVRFLIEQYPKIINEWMSFDVYLQLFHSDKLDQINSNFKRLKHMKEFE